MDVLDPDVLSQLRMLPGETGGALLGEVIDVFDAELPRRVAAIAEAVRAGDARGLEAATHSLRGSAAALGALHLTEACRLMEAAAARGEVSDALLPELQSAAEAARAALQREKSAT